MTIISGNAESYNASSLSLDRKQKQAVALLSVGTLLEYFDLMLYLHMSVLLTELFYPATDFRSQQLIMAGTFSATYAARPLGALIFGYIGDNYGRKITIVITTTLMAGACLVMANLPTYQTIGIAASYLITICRTLQGLASMGELVGAQLYITEMTRPPVQYPAVGVMSICASLGGTLALTLTNFVLSQGLSWRVGFWVGAIVAIIGVIARLALRETPDFADAKRRVQRAIIKTNQDPQILEANSIWQEKVENKTALSLFLIKCASPISFYLLFVYCISILQGQFGYNPAQVIKHQLLVTIIHTMGTLIATYISYRVYPLFILKLKLVMFFSLTVAFPYLMQIITAPWQLQLLQCTIALFPIDNTPAISILLSHLPVFKRFTYGSFAFGLSRSAMAVITAQALVHLTTYFGHYGLLLVTVPVSIAYWYGLQHFICLEKNLGHYPDKIINEPAILAKLHQ